MGVDNCQSQQETEVTSTPSRTVENVVITTKGLQDRNNLLSDGRMVVNKGKLILHREFDFYKTIGSGMSGSSV